MAKKLANKIIIVGCGPGSKKYISGQAMQYIKDADVLVGSRRLLSLFQDVEADKYTINRNYRLLIARIISLSRSRNVIVLVSGDPGFFSYARLIIDKAGIENCEVIPGISSVQLAFAKIGRDWNDAVFISLHGRTGRLTALIKKVRGHDKVAVLTDNSNNIKRIARRLLNEGIKDRRIYVCENLSLDNEKIREFDVSAIEKVRVRGLNIIIILNEGKGE